jgi:hypothetical protein
VTPRQSSLSATSGQSAAIWAIADEPILATHPDHKVWFDEVRFSPDGKILAVVISAPQDAPGGPNEVWLYDMRSQQCVPVVLTTPLLADHLRNDLSYVVARDDLRVAWADDETLYVTGTYEFRVAATMAGGKKISAFPAKIAAAFTLPKKHADEYTDTKKCTDGALVRNDEFGITAESLNPKCNSGYYLMLRRKNGTGVRKIADIADQAGTLVDADRKLVVYEKLGFESATIGAFDLNTRQSRELVLPSARALKLLDRTRDGIVAYRVADSCVPRESPEPVLKNPSGPTNGELRYVPQVCFVRFP